MLDREGLQVAYLGIALAHFLDLETGEIVDQPLDAEAPGPPDRYLRIPGRTADSEAHDRVLFVESKAARVLRDELEPVLGDAQAFRQVLSRDRFVERAFFTFKNDRASLAIEEWIAEQGLS
jgi:hypothetical protein